MSVFKVELAVLYWLIVKNSKNKVWKISFHGAFNFKALQKT